MAPVRTTSTLENPILTAKKVRDSVPSIVRSNDSDRSFRGGSGGFQESLSGRNGSFHESHKQTPESHKCGHLVDWTLQRWGLGYLYLDVRSHLSINLSPYRHSYLRRRISCRSLHSYLHHPAPNANLDGTLLALTCLVHEISISYAPY